MTGLTPGGTGDSCDFPAHMLQVVCAISVDEEQEK
jgi:hypothetical protein